MNFLIGGFFTAGVRLDLLTNLALALLFRNADITTGDASSETYHSAHILKVIEVARKFKLHLISLPLTLLHDFE